MKNKCKRLAIFPTNQSHKAMASLNNQTFYGTGPLTIKHKNMIYINLAVKKYLLQKAFNGELVK